MDSTIQETTAAWRAAVERRDAGAARGCLAANAVSISPLTERFRFEGRNQVHEVFAAAFDVFDEIRFHTELGDDNTRALSLYGRCGPERFEEAQLLPFDTTGLIRELTLFGRPLPGLTAVMAAIGPRMLHRQRRSAPPG